MQENLAQDLSLERIARECCLSRAHFARYFKNSTGMPAHKWLQCLRIEHAKQLLQAPDKSLTQIALDCGFADQSHFTRVFKSFVGVTPGIWRRLHYISCVSPDAHK